MSGRSPVDEQDWERLITQLSRGDCTPFLGAGACHGTLPTAAQLSAEWAARYDYPFTDRHDLARVMLYVSTVKRDAIFLKEEVCEDFRGKGPPPFEADTEPHALLARFPIGVFVTTNYDDFLMRALTREGKTPRSAICPWYEPANADFDEFFADVPAVRPPEREPLVFHLHGSVNVPKSLVLTADDYLEFLANIAASRSDEGPQLVPNVVLSAMTDYPLLFVGYSLEDWTFRVLFHGLLRARSDVLRRRSVSVQLLPPVNGSIAEAERKAEEYLIRYLEGWRISIFWGTAAEFCAELRRRMGSSP